MHDMVEPSAGDCQESALHRHLSLLIPSRLSFLFVKVVGDHQHHAPSVPHWAQLGYLAFACAIPLVPQLLGHALEAAVARAIALSESRNNGNISLRGIGLYTNACAAGGKALLVAVVTDLRFAFGLLRHEPTGVSRGAGATDNGVSWRTILHAALVWLTLLVFAAWGLRVGSLAHPFLLADNRHFTFYLWRRLLGHPNYGAFIRVALAPVYLLCMGVLAARLNASSLPQQPLQQHLSQYSLQQQQQQRQQQRSALWPVLWFGASAVCLLPSPLLEFRYFTVPLLVAHTQAAPYLLPRHEQMRGDAEQEEEVQQPNEETKKSVLSPPETKKELPNRHAADRWPRGMGAVLCLGACFLLVDAALLYMFLAKPFAWPDGSVARFMW